MLCYFLDKTKKYFGSGQYSNKIKTTKADPWHFRDQSIEIDIPPLGMVVFKYENKVVPKSKKIVKPKSIVKTKPKAKSTKKTKPKTK